VRNPWRISFDRTNGQFCERTVSASQLVKASEQFPFGFLSEPAPYATGETEITIGIVLTKEKCSYAHASASNWDVASDHEGFL